MKRYLRLMCNSRHSVAEHLSGNKSPSGSARLGIESEKITFETQPLLSQITTQTIREYDTDIFNSHLV